MLTIGIALLVFVTTRNVALRTTSTAGRVIVRSVHAAVLKGVRPCPHGAQWPCQASMLQANTYQTAKQRMPSAVHRSGVGTWTPLIIHLLPWWELHSGGSREGSRLSNAVLVTDLSVAPLAHTSHEGRGSLPSYECEEPMIRDALNVDSFITWNWSQLSRAMPSGSTDLQGHGCRSSEGLGHISAIRQD